MRKPFVIRSTKRYLSKQVHERIVLLRFGVDVEQQEPIRSYPSIAKLLCLPVSTVYFSIKRFVDRGFKIEMGRKRPTGRFLKLSDEMKQWLLSDDLIYKKYWMSAMQRYIYLKEHFNYTGCYYTILDFYKSQKIRLVKPQKTYAASIEADKMFESDRKLFARQIGTIKMNNKPLIYVDETTFNIQKYFRTVWSPA